MPDPASPRAARLATPGWLDSRLVLGVLLVLVSVVVGARLLSAPDGASAVWVTTHDLAPGSTLAAADLREGRARLFDSGDRYLRATGDKPVGYVLARGVGRDELLPRDSLRAPDAPGGAVRDVSVPVAAGHLPDDLQAGQLVDVFVTPQRTAAAGAAGPAGAAGAAAPGAATPTTRLVLSRVPVGLRPRSGGVAAASTQSVVLSVPQGDAPALVAAVQEGGIDLVRVPVGAALPALDPRADAAPAG